MQVTSDLKLLYPLSDFYEESGLPLPSATQLNGQDVPEPYRNLLVHERDLTPTIEAAYHQSVRLRVLRYSLREDVFSRQVVLTLERDARAVVFGAIKIYLERFPPEARRLVLEKKLPVGTILHTQRILHQSRPAAYFQVTADLVIGEAFRLKDLGVLYGRQNVLSDSSHQTLARVIEILPPWEGIESVEGAGE